MQLADGPARGRFKVPIFNPHGVGHLVAILAPLKVVVRDPEVRQQPPVRIVWGGPEDQDKCGQVRGAGKIEPANASAVAQ
ncbi:hypothetical protein D3C84_956300 [compost metagenome]